MNKKVMLSVFLAFFIILFLGIILATTTVSNPV